MVVLESDPTVLVVGTSVVVVPLAQTAALCRKDTHASVPDATIDPYAPQNAGHGAEGRRARVRGAREHRRSVVADAHAAGGGDLDAVGVHRPRGVDRDALAAHVPGGGHEDLTGADEEEGPRIGPGREGDRDWTAIAQVRRAGRESYLRLDHDRVGQGLSSAVCT